MAKIDYVCYVNPHYSNPNRVTTYLYFDWLKGPGIRLKDANSISWTDNLIHPVKGNGVYNYFTAYFSDGSGRVYPIPKIKLGKFGLLQELDLNISRHYYQGTLGTDLEFANQGGGLRQANIFSEYCHSQIAGSISVGVDGKPSFGFDVSVDRAQGPTAVVKKRY